jgi:hypothetical protein
LLLNEKETRVSLSERLKHSTYIGNSAANIRKFKADSFVIDDKMAVTVAIKRAEVSSVTSNEPIPEAKRMKIEEDPSLTELPSPSEEFESVPPTQESEDTTIPVSS